MKAIRIAAPGKVEIVEIEKPVAGPGEAIIKPLYGGICGSDLNSFRGSNAYLTYPRIPGHEFSAEIVEIGENDRGFKPGDVVTANPYFNCGQCYSCKKGLVNACMSNQTMGVQRDACVGAPLKNRVQAGDKVLVVGAGTIGLLAAIAAKSRGAKVWICDVAPMKLEYALRFGIDGTVLNTSPDALKNAIDEITDGNGFDVTVECVGLPSTFQNCLDAACFGGRVSVIGVGKHNIDLDFTIIQKKELNIYGSRNAMTRDFEELIDTVKSQDLKLDGVVTNVYDFENAVQAFEDFSANANNMLKVMIKF